VEEQFYFIWPILILLIKKPKILLIAVVMLLLLVGATRFLLWEYEIKDLAYANLYLFTRIDGLCIGSILALLMYSYSGAIKKYITIVVLVLALLNFAFYFINLRHVSKLPYLAFIGYTTLAMLFGILVYEGVAGKSKIINFIFGNAVMKFFGKISYGLYVYHWPVYILLFSFFTDLLTSKINISTRIAEICSGIIVTVAGIIISVISYQYFEKPFLKLKNRFT